jgi:hypothetical protein
VNVNGTTVCVASEIAIAFNSSSTGLGAMPGPVSFLNPHPVWQKKVYQYKYLKLKKIETVTNCVY